VNSWRLFLRKGLVRDRHGSAGYDAGRRSRTRPRVSGLFSNKPSAPSRRWWMLPPREADPFPKDRGGRPRLSE
jgi:hypothetical protein